jgi:N-acetylglucosaminyldiphosphoundecaprenol N-acetyl-beta-D-mannosaminyltransferase
MRMVFDRIPVDRIDMQGTIDRIVDALAGSRTRSLHVVTPNAQFVHIARSNSRFTEIVQKADLSVADGVPLVWASRLLGSPLPGRVNGTDLMMRLSEEAARRGWSVYLLGGRPGAAEGAAAALHTINPSLRIAGIDCPEMDFMLNAKLDCAAAERIRRAAPDILFVALGAPKQEMWIDEHRDLPVGVMIGVGGSFELVSGVTRRAPAFLQHNGFEWLWRLVMEPKRMWKRYLVGNSLFLSILFRLWMQRILAFENQPAGVAE